MYLPKICFAGAVVAGVLLSSGCFMLVPESMPVTASVFNFQPTTDSSEFAVKPDTELTLLPDGGLHVFEPKFQPGHEVWPGYVLTLPEDCDSRFALYDTLVLDLQTPMAENFLLRVGIINQAGENATVVLDKGCVTTADRTEVKIPLNDFGVDLSDVTGINLHHVWLGEDLEYTLYDITLEQGDLLGKARAGRELLDQVLADSTIPENCREAAKTLRDVFPEIIPENKAMLEDILLGIYQFREDNISDILHLIYPESALVPTTEAAPETIVSSDGREMKLVWTDEFNGSGLPDPSAWKYENGYVRNGEAQFYTKERLKNVRQENGALLIESHLEDAMFPDPNDPEKECHAVITSASINSENLKMWTRGRIEVRAKLPGGKGSWPAIWLLGSAYPYPYNGEIDIMEYVGYDPKTVYGTVHLATNPGPYPLASKGKTRAIDDPQHIYHIYSCEWDENSLKIMVDGEVYHTLTREEASGYTNGARWVFDKDNPVYLLLNNAVGGGWGSSMGIDKNAFPMRYYIDYVRYYDYVD